MDDVQFRIVQLPIKPMLRRRMEVELFHLIEGVITVLIGENKGSRVGFVESELNNVRNTRRFTLTELGEVSILPV